jgi:cell division protein FtsL
LLEAKQISHVYGDYSYKPRPVAKPKPEAKKANNLAVKVAIVSCVLLAVITGLLLTATHTQITYKTDNIIQLKREISDLQNANERLKLEIARLKSLDRVEFIATTELGMIQPGINDVEYIAFEDTNMEAEPALSDAADKETQATVEVASGERMHPIILAVNKLIFDYIFPKTSSEE